MKFSMRVLYGWVEMGRIGSYFVFIYCFYLFWVSVCNVFVNIIFILVNFFKCLFLLESRMFSLLMRIYFGLLLWF